MPIFPSSPVFYNNDAIFSYLKHQLKIILNLPFFHRKNEKNTAGKSKICCTPPDGFEFHRFRH